MRFSRHSRSEAPDDATLFNRFLTGDDAALAELLDRHNRRLYAYCLKFLGDPHAALDVMQEAWERIVRMRSTGESVASPEGLLMRIVRNLSLNHLRDRRPHLSMDDLTPAQHPRAAANEPSYLEELVVMALDRLPLPQREVIILHVYSGYSYTEIARMLGAAEVAVRMRAMRGRAHLARIMTALMAVEEERVRDLESHDGSRTGVRP